MRVVIVLSMMLGTALATLPVRAQVDPQSLRAQKAQIIAGFDALTAFEPALGEADRKACQASYADAGRQLADARRNARPGEQPYIWRVGDVVERIEAAVQLGAPDAPDWARTPPQTVAVLCSADGRAPLASLLASYRGRLILTPEQEAAKARRQMLSDLSETISGAREVAARNAAQPPE